MREPGLGDGGDDGRRVEEEPAAKERRHDPSPDADVDPGGFVLEVAMGAFRRRFVEEGVLADGPEAAEGEAGRRRRRQKKARVAARDRRLPKGRTPFPCRRGLDGPAEERELEAIVARDGHLADEPRPVRQPKKRTLAAAVPLLHLEARRKLVHRVHEELRPLGDPPQRLGELGSRRRPRHRAAKVVVVGERTSATAPPKGAPRFLGPLRLSLRRGRRIQEERRRRPEADELLLRRGGLLR
mmetsp:Transcript_4126/g.13558  ORF Transcript_4126/g.13558 Transcript_4126/m.13558 type:complete len:241 (-) Transcript_4126:188-910(-)